MAEAFAKANPEGNGPRRTVVFMTVSGEEKGLWGSEYYSDHPVFPLDKTTVDLNTDMVGRIDTERKTADTSNYIYVIGHDKLSSDLPVINEGVNNKYTKLTLDYKFDDPQIKNEFISAAIITILRAKEFLYYFSMTECYSPITISPPIPLIKLILS